MLRGDDEVVDDEQCSPLDPFVGGRSDPFVGGRRDPLVGGRRDPVPDGNNEEANEEREAAESADSCGSCAKLGNPCNEEKLELEVKLLELWWVDDEWVTTGEPP